MYTFRAHRNNRINVIWKGVFMKSENSEKMQQKKEKEEFNSVTQKKKVENQNQTHNVRAEGIGHENQKR